MQPQDQRGPIAAVAKPAAPANLTVGGVLKKLFGALLGKKKEKDA